MHDGMVVVWGMPAALHRLPRVGFVQAAELALGILEWLQRCSEGLECFLCCGTQRMRMSWLGTLPVNDAVSV